MTLRILIALAVLGMPVAARADLLIDLQDATITPGGNVTVDVLISGVDDAFNPVTQMDQILQDYEVILNITPQAGVAAGTSLQFVDPQSEAFLTDPSYIFFGSSETVLDPTLGSATTVATIAETNDTFTAVDTSVDALFDPVDVTITSNNLLLRYELVHDLNGADAASTIGDSFTVALDSSSGFFDSAGTDIDFDESFSTGSITVAAAVPEPSTVIGSGVALLMVIGYGLRRRRPKAAVATV